MSENKHGRPFGGRGYYIGLILCAAAIGITGFVYRAGREEPAVQTANTPASITGEAKLPTRGTTPPFREPMRVWAIRLGIFMAAPSLSILRYSLQ